MSNTSCPGQPEWAGWGNRRHAGMRSAYPENGGTNGGETDAGLARHEVEAPDPPPGDVSVAVLIRTWNGPTPGSAISPVSVASR